MSSLVEAFKKLEDDLTAQPIRIAAHSDMPFAIFQYPPTEEFGLRKYLRLLAITLQQHGKRVRFISVASLVWEAVHTCEGSDYLYKTESLRGFNAGQQHIKNLLSSEDHYPITESLLKKISLFTPEKDVVFLVRVGAFAPSIYHSSDLLGELHTKTRIPVILFYPGSADSGTDLHFYDLPTQSSMGAYNYRVRVYGARA